MTYARLPSGVIAPIDLAKATMADMLFGNAGAYRSASSRNKNTVGWITSDGSADADTLADLPTLRRQSRDLVRNEPLPSGAIAGVVTSVVGTGVIPQSRIDAKFLGISQDEADEWQQRAERVFNQFADGDHFDAERKQNFWLSQATVLRSKLESGDVFAVRRYIPRPSKVLGLAVQLVEADRVATPLTKSTEGNIRAGIETDSDGAPAAYHIMQQHPGDSITADTEFTRIDAFDKIGNPIVLAIIPRLRPGQTRGVPYLAPVIEPLKQLSRYTEAEITAAVISGMFAVFVKSPAPTGPLSGGIPGMVGGQQIVPNGNGLQKMQSGMIVDLAPGEEVQTASATRPNTAFDGFVTSVLRQIGVGLELPFEVLIKHFTASYSAARAAILEAFKFYLRERDFLVQTYCQPVWNWAISEAVARGILKAPRFFDDLFVRSAYLGADWVGPGVPQLDVVKEANAAKIWNELNIKSLQRIGNEQNIDHERETRQIAREREQLAKLPAAPAPVNPGSDPKPEDRDDDE